MGVSISKKVTHCVSCPEASGCKVWGALNAKQRFFMKTSPSAVNILPGCPHASSGAVNNG